MCYIKHADCGLYTIPTKGNRLYRSMGNPKAGHKTSFDVRKERTA